MAKLKKSIFAQASEKTPAGQKAKAGLREKAKVWVKKRRGSSPASRANAASAVKLRQENAARKKFTQKSASAGPTVTFTSAKKGSAKGNPQSLRGGLPPRKKLWLK